MPRVLGLCGVGPQKRCFVGNVPKWWALDPREKSLFILLDA